jgi:hypothetical protein
VIVRIAGPKGYRLMLSNIAKHREHVGRRAGATYVMHAALLVERANWLDTHLVSALQG